VLPPVADVARGVWRGVRWLAPFVAVLVVVAGVGYGGWRGWQWVKTSPRFAVTEIVVTGNTRVTREEIVRRAAIPPGANVFTLPLDVVRAGVAEDPWIASVETERQLPGRVIIKVTERMPAAVVLLGGMYLADAKGELFKRATIEAGEADGLVAVSGLDRRLWTTDPAAGAAAVREALDLAAHWRWAAERPALGEVHVDPSGFTIYTLEGAVAVRLARAQGPDLDARLDRFDVIWAALTPEERALARTVHLDSATRPDRVTVKLADAWAPARGAGPVAK
jgi:cell division protein FtsQ